VRAMVRSVLVVSSLLRRCRNSCWLQSVDREQISADKWCVLMDGEPLEGVSVVLQQEKLPMVASGKTDKRRTITMSTYAKSDGAAVGNCVATVTAIQVDLSELQKEVPIADNSSITDVEERARANKAAFGERRAKLEKMQKERDKNKKLVTVPKKYSDVKTSDLKFKIEPSKKNEIKSN